MKQPDFFDTHGTAGYIAKGVLSATAGVALGYAIVWLLRYFGLIPGGPEDVQTTIRLFAVLWLALVVGIYGLYMLLTYAMSRTMARG